MTARPDLPLDRWASTDVLAAAVDVETARRSGASWAEIPAASGMYAPAARRLYDQTLTRQKAFGYAAAHRVDPGVPEL